MKLTAAALVPLLAHGALAFVPSSTQQPKFETTTTTLRAETKCGGNVLAEAAAAASTCLVGLSLLTSQAAFANDNDAAMLQRLSSTTISPSSTIYLAEIEQFSLPSYDSSKGSTLIDISGDVEKVNKKTLQAAKARREAEDKSAEKLAADELRRAEKEGGSLLESMIGSAESDKKAFIEAEKAEARANRWKTF
eukprot:CAMPEP_0172553394 /NCGR_PEP_ID=MMETSP1067-20121228/50613_1 /TAXON_ID=265564 ORGANISM="Thalassiosira punctigera, Strain Tpunct2005C2" /NCGR_SAMPLE_ID=MMETSP1067 /ASSEMBLY_ACC=CAM_ASM_000444 /LENGTH=192 /DNA_ID=CAMNT_0013341571 /DNA_START=81 /DNA_END=659 /DNA_ORIENTATION=+